MRQIWVARCIDNDGEKFGGAWKSFDRAFQWCKDDALKFGEYALSVDHKPDVRTVLWPHPGPLNKHLHWQVDALLLSEAV